MRMGMGEIIVVLVVVLLIFGANKIPQLGDAIGKGIKNFKKAQRDQDDAIDVTPRPQPPQQLHDAPGAPQSAAPDRSTSEKR